MAHILIDDLTPRVSYTVGGSAQSAFTVPFPFFEDADLVVYNGTTLLALTTNYTVTGEGADSGGTVTLNVAVTNTTITIVRDVPNKRVTDFPNSGPMRIPELNTQFDKIVAVAQQLEDKIERTIRLPESEATTDQRLPPLADRAGKFAAWDSAGNFVGNSTPGTGGVSAGNPTGTVGLVAVNGVATTWMRSDAAPKIHADFAFRTPGLTADGTTSNNTAVTAALSGQAAARRYLMFGPGVYYFADDLTISVGDDQGLSIMGLGQDVTQLRFASGKGLIINYADSYLSSSSVTICHLSVTTDDTTNTAIGVKLYSAAGGYSETTGPTQITNVNFHGYGNQSLSNAPPGAYWSICVDIKGVQNVYFNAVTFLAALNHANGQGYTTLGKGVRTTSNTGANSSGYNFVNCNWSYVGVSFIYGQGIQGVTFTGCNMVGGENGIYVPPDQTGLDWLAITNSHINVTGIGIWERTAVEGTQISNCLFVVPVDASYGVLITNATSELKPSSIIGNWFFGGGTNEYGVVIEQVWGVNIIGNTFNGLFTGVLTSLDAAYIHCAFNHYQSCTADFVNTSANTSSIWRGLKCTTLNTTAIAAP